MAFPPPQLFSSNQHSVRRTTACTVGAQTRTKKYWQQMGSPERKIKLSDFHLDESLGTLRKEEMGKMQA